MSLTIDRAFQAKPSVLRNISGRLKNYALAKSPAKSAPIYTPEKKLILPPNLQEQEQKEVQKIQTIKIGPEEILEIIEGLETVADENLANPIGFKTDPRDDEDFILGNRAANLAKILKNGLDPKAVKSAIEFLNVVSIIYELRDVAKEMSREFGFRGNEKTDGDKFIAQKAGKLARILVRNNTQKNLQVAIQLLQTVDLINELEALEGETQRLPEIGFFPGPPDKNEVMIGDMAGKLAEALKVNQDDETVSSAIEFLKLATQVLMIKKLQNVEQQKENKCFGIHCSLEEEDAFSLAA